MVKLINWFLFLCPCYFSYLLWFMGRKSLDIHSKLFLWSLGAFCMFAVSVMIYEVLAHNFPDQFETFIKKIKRN